MQWLDPPSRKPYQFPNLYHGMGFKYQYYGASSRTLSLVFNGVVVCYYKTRPAELCVSHDTLLIKVNSDLENVCNRGGPETHQDVAQRKKK
jgi:hypothetical protein